MKKKDYKKKNKTIQYSMFALCGILCVCAGCELATSDWLSAIADFIFISATILYLLNTRLFDEFIDNTAAAADLALIVLKDVIKHEIDEETERIFQQMKGGKKCVK